MPTRKSERIQDDIFINSIILKILSILYEWENVHGLI